MKLKQNGFFQHLMKTKTFRLSIVVAIVLFLLSLPFMIGVALDEGGLFNTLFLILFPAVCSILFCFVMAGVIWALNPNWREI